MTSSGRRGRPRDHNELFPSTDWRYLLPEPEPDTAVVLARSRVGPMARELGAQIVDEGGPPVDLGVADEVDGAMVERLLDMVRPGGTVYIELAWPRWRSVGRLARRLVDAGLVDPVVYSLSPSTSRWSPSWWIPVGDADGLRFVAGQVRSGRSGHHSAADRVRNLLTGLLQATPASVSIPPWLLHPTRKQRVCIVARTPPGDDRLGSSEPGLLPLPPSPFLRRGRAVMRVGGSSTDQAMLFGFGDGDQPEMVIKAPVRPEEVAGSRHEARMLVRLNQGADPVPGTPRPIAVPTGDRVVAFGQSFVSGSPLADVVDPASLWRHGGAMNRWSIELAERSANSVGSPTLADPERRVVTELAPMLVGLPDGRAVLDLARARLGAIGDIPSVIQHRDLGPWNVLVDGDAHRVIDWADATTAGPPICDLHHFLTHLTLCAFDAYGPEQRRVIASRLADPSSGLGRQLEDHLATYGAAVGLGAETIGGLRVLTWLLDLLRRSPDERVDSIYLDLLLAELGLLGAAAASTDGAGDGSPVRRSSSQP